ncbi:olfactory receptor 5A1-like isoform X2 [Pleurodeles waltl]|uniref:olfactory receptor 5A1-like isoform X2 n=1 Tax=Pleurodeles waltl TaxID=8319 RepID=UPI0037093FBF
MQNITTVTEFILLGFATSRDLQIVLFVVFLPVYITSLLGNISMMVLIQMDSRLHSPMYYFLSNLSFTDLCYSTVITPRMLAEFISYTKVISFPECAVQLFFFGVLGVLECLLLAVMAYDRYVAICNPLLYTSIMSSRVCCRLVSLALVGGFLSSVVMSANTLSLNFCGPNEINHFFCNFLPLIQLSCKDATARIIGLLLIVIAVGFISFSTILVSYVYILSTILRIHSAAGRSKAFSTCASHLTVVCLFYGTGLIMYVQPSTNYSQEQDKAVSVFYTVLIPMLNPLIYSLRNKEVKEALRKAMYRKRR